jgi:antitoxin component YwqK of YwqJK toxin-antitoxin module
MKIILSSIITLASILNCFSQTDSIFYFNEYWEKTSKDSAEFYRIGRATYGIFHGKITNYYKSGRIQMTGNYMNGKQNGEFIWYYENGKEKERVVYTHGESTILSAFDSTGKQTTINGYGYHELYYKNNIKKSVINYYNGNRNGKYVKWYDNGNKSEEGEYVKGKFRLFNSWSKNGEPMVIDGNGKYQLFYSNGQIHTVGNYKNQRRNGLWKSYYINGKLMEKGSYVDGYKNGNWTYYYDNGKIWEQDSLVKGKLINTKFFPVKGLKEVIVFEDYFNDNANFWIEVLNDSTCFSKQEQGNYIIKTFDKNLPLFLMWKEIIVSEKENFRIKSAISLIEAKDKTSSFGIFWGGGFNFQDGYCYLINNNGEYNLSKKSKEGLIPLTYDEYKYQKNSYVIEIVKENNDLYLYIDGEKVKKRNYLPTNVTPLSVGFAVNKNTSVAIDYIIVSQW